MTIVAKYAFTVDERDEHMPKLRAAGNQDRTLPSRDGRHLITSLWNFIRP